MRAVTGYDPAAIASAGGRMTAAVFPGDTLRCEFWRDGSGLLFRATAIERAVRVIDGGRIELRDDA
jgi:acyl dehydratase